MALLAKQELEDADLLCPMIDARRMEVYAALYDANLEQVRKTEAEIIDENSFAEWFQKHKITFFGDGSDKCKTTLQHPNAEFLDGLVPLAMAMVSLAEEKFEKQDFVDVAYYEPHYLKEFMVTTSKKDLLGLGKK